MKICNQCGESKDLSLFKEGGKKPTCKTCDALRARTRREVDGEHVRAVGRKYFQSNESARQKRNARTRAWRERIGPQAVREGDERSRYGITRREMGSACAVCGSPDHLCIDHDHTCCPGTRSCGKCVRDVLCVSCNTLIGKLESNRGRLEVVKGYLKLWNATF